jgi:phytoene dehydrogenase-like protein
LYLLCSFHDRIQTAISLQRIMMGTYLMLTSDDTLLHNALITKEYADAIIVGAGLGGLLIAAKLARAGKRPLVLERLPFAGGRFMAQDVRGFELSTGALHLIPFGESGPLASELRALGITRPLVPSNVFCSFHWQGRHFVARKPLDVLRFLPWQARLDALRIAIELKLRTRWPGTFGQWLRQRTRQLILLRIFERFVEFALSLSIDDITYDEMRAIFKNVVHHRLPAVPQSGCRGIINDLVSVIERCGGEVRTSVAVRRLLLHAERVIGVEAEQRASGERSIILAPVVVSDLGPSLTADLLQHGGEQQSMADRQCPTDGREARGLKVHVALNHPFIGHSGIMFCLDTQRIAGIVEVTAAEPSLAPPGKHLLITFQTLEDNVTIERQRALEDLRMILGPDFEEAEILRISAYHGGWPVNRVLQGQDRRNSIQPIPGLFMVGDAYKPMGYFMAEAVAAGVASTAPRVLAELNERRQHICGALRVG